MKVKHCFGLRCGAVKGGLGDPLRMHISLSYFEQGQHLACHVLLITFCNHPAVSPNSSHTYV